MAATTLDNQESGIMYLDGADLIDGGSSTISNHGSLYKTNATVTTLAVPFENYGSFYVQNGGVTVSKLFTCTGQVVVSQPATFVSLALIPKNTYFL